MGAGQLVEAEDGVQGRADVVGHVGKKHRFIGTGLFRRTERRFQDLLLFALLRDGGIDVLEAGKQALVVLGSKVLELVVMRFPVIDDAIGADVLGRLRKLGLHGFKPQGVVEALLVFGVHALFDVAAVRQLVRVNGIGAGGKAGSYEAVELQHVYRIVFRVHQENVQVVLRKRVEQGQVMMSSFLQRLALAYLFRDVHAVQHALQVAGGRVLHHAGRQAGPADTAVVEVRLNVTVLLYRPAFICPNQSFAVELGKCLFLLVFFRDERKGLGKRGVNRHLGLHAFQVVGGRAVHGDAAVFGKVEMHDALRFGDGAQKGLHLGLEALLGTTAGRYIDRILNEGGAAIPFAGDGLHRENLRAVVHLAAASRAIALQKRAERALMVQTHHVLVAMAAPMVFVSAAKSPGRGVDVHHGKVVQERHLNQLVRLVQDAFEHLGLPGNEFGAFAFWRS